MRELSLEGLRSPVFTVALGAFLIVQSADVAIRLSRAALCARSGNYAQRMQPQAEKIKAAPARARY